MANDGNGRDSDPSDPGDWINSTDKDNPLYADCDMATSRGMARAWQAWSAR